MMKLITIGTIFALLASSSMNVDAAGRTKKSASALGSEEQEQEDRSLFIDENNLDSELVFQRSYIAITASEDFPTLIADQSDPGMNGIIGAIQTQSGGVYDPANIQIVNRPNGTTVQDLADSRIENTPGLDALSKVAVGLQFAGKAQPKFVPQRDVGFFLDGQCTATGGKGNSAIDKHTCVLNLCLGGGGFNCLGLYCGTAFIFDPFKQPPNSFKNAPNLPPSYPCVIIGGTNVFQGAKGNVDITTLTGRTAPKASGVGSDIQLAQFGFITQRLNVVSNVPLPPAP